MDEINLKQIITDFPDCVTNGAKLKAILLDTYPEASRGIINAILIISISGIAKEIQNSANIDKIATDRWLKKLENDYCMSGLTVEKCLQLWINAFTQEETIPLLSEKPSISDKEVIKMIQDDYLDGQPIDISIKKYITYCSYIIRNFAEYKGVAFYRLAEILHKWDLFVRNEEFMMDEDGNYSLCDFCCESIPFWSSISEELRAIKVLANIKTNNLNLIIEMLLLLSAKYGNKDAFSDLEETYLDFRSYDFDSYDFDFYSEYPWFDISCMNTDFDSIKKEKDLDFSNFNQIDEKTKYHYAQKALDLLQDYKACFSGNYDSDIAFYISNIANYYNTIEEILGGDFYKKELPFIRLYADKGNSEMIGLILDYYKNHDIANYWSNFIKYGKDGDYRTQCKIAEFYNNQFDDMHQESDFQEASKWYELAIDNKARDIDSLVIENYKKMLEQYDAKKYSDKINDLQEKINACHSEWDWRMRYV